MSRSGFYAYQSRRTHPKIDAEEVALLARVQAIAVATRSSYGSRRMAKALQAEGFVVGRVKARRLMKEAGVQVQRAKRRAPVTTDSRHGSPAPWLSSGRRRAALGGLADPPAHPTVARGTGGTPKPLLEYLSAGGIDHGRFVPRTR